MKLEPHELARLREKFPHSSLVFVEPAPRCDLPPIDKRKFVVPKTTSIGQFLFILRKRIQLPPEKAMFLFIRNELPTSSTTFAELEKYVDADGAIRVTYTSESTFG